MFCVSRSCNEGPRPGDGACGLRHPWSYFWKCSHVGQIHWTRGSDSPSHRYECPVGPSCVNMEIRGFQGPPYPGKLWNSSTSLIWMSVDNCDRMHSKFLTQCCTLDWTDALIRQPVFQFSITISFRYSLQSLRTLHRYDLLVLPNRYRNRCGIVSRAITVGSLDIE